VIDPLSPESVSYSMQIQFALLSGLKVDNLVTAWTLIDVLILITPRIVH